MATGRSYFTRQNYRFLSGERDSPIMTTSDAMFELDESDVWNSNRSSSPEFRKAVPSSRLSKKPSKRSDHGDRVGATAASLPVNVPDWSKILREDYRENNRRRENGDVDDDEEDDDGSDGGNRIPPHEFLARQMARTRIASFSVHEGIGRTFEGEGSK
ncbi:hypothetical protein L1049_013291 [Liquidambar formosana]|uniref:Uncharacterized protein n=1 Tax=Liquidambar formosana TaxID=63359 RepID=A0AAP0RKB3_LIQFO